MDPRHIKENFDVFDFKLSDEDMEEIKKLNNDDSLFFNHQDPEMVRWFDEMVETRRNQHKASSEQKKW